MYYDPIIALWEAEVRLEDLRRGAELRRTPKVAKVRRARRRVWAALAGRGGSIVERNTSGRNRADARLAGCWSIQGAFGPAAPVGAPPGHPYPGRSHECHRFAGLDKGNAP